MRRLIIAATLGALTGVLLVSCAPAAPASPTALGAQKANTKQ